MTLPVVVTKCCAPSVYLSVIKPGVGPIPVSSNSNTWLSRGDPFPSMRTKLPNERLCPDAGILIGLLSAAKFNPEMGIAVPSTKNGLLITGGRTLWSSTGAIASVFSVVLGAAVIETRPIELVLARDTYTLYSNAFGTDAHETFIAPPVGMYLSAAILSSPVSFATDVTFIQWVPVPPAPGAAGSISVGGVILGRKLVLLNTQLPELFLVNFRGVLPGQVIDIVFPSWALAYLNVGSSAAEYGVFWITYLLAVTTVAPCPSTAATLPPVLSRWIFFRLTFPTATKVAGG